jgi:hypothetical protein
MSRVNGDKARFHKARKKNIERRLRTKELLTAAGIKLGQVGASKNAASAPAGKKTRV